MEKISIEHIKDYANNSALVIQLLVLPIIGMFLMLIASNNIVSSETAKQLNITFLHTAVLAYTHYIIPLTAIITTVRDIIRYKNNIEDEMIKIIVSSVTVFITVAFIFCNFQLSLGLDVIDIETCIYYTATSMIEFIAISFFIFGIYLIGNHILNTIKSNKDM